MNDPMWTLVEALDLVKRLNHANLHWNVALGGGVLNKGFSYKDLDLVFYPHESGNEPLDKLHTTFGHFNWTRVKTSAEMLAHWKSKGSKDRKFVEVWKTAEDKRVDVIIPSIWSV